ncbi:MAG: hypothetical protein PVJ62_00635 [Deltaproteobacteria bacterium]|jgi:hypothetical protein
MKIETTLSACKYGGLEAVLEQVTPEKADSAKLRSKKDIEPKILEVGRCCFPD